MLNIKIKMYRDLKSRVILGETTPNPNIEMDPN